MKLGVTASLALAGALASAGFLAIPGSAQATLHGFCSTAAPCTDTGTNTPTSVNPPDFGFSAGGHSAMGDVMIDILVPKTLELVDDLYDFRSVDLASDFHGLVVLHYALDQSVFIRRGIPAGHLSRHIGKPE